MSAKRRASESRAAGLRWFLQEADDRARLAGDAGRRAGEVGSAPARPWPVRARGRLLQAAAHGASVHPFEAIGVVATEIMQRRLRCGRCVRERLIRTERN